MQVSLETLSDLERKLTIEVPAEKIDSQLQSRLSDAAKTFQMKGFRKGKVPIKVIKDRFGEGLRQEVLSEVMNQSYYEAVSQEKVKPAGYPKIEPVNIKAGENLTFTAIFEVFPDVVPGDFSKIEIEKKTAEINDTDIDKMIQTLREQRKTFVEVERAAINDDQLDIDFVGEIDGEEFEGGAAKGSKLILGSNTMIPGFEDGLLGAKKDEDVVLKLQFPEQYHKEDYAGKDCEFKVHINSVSESALPELNDDFFSSFDVKEGGEEKFREEIKNNMTRELKNAAKNNLKNQVIEGLLEVTDVSSPKAMVDNEINNLRQQAIQQYGGNQQIDPSLLPAEMFQAQAEQRVSVGLILNEIIEKNELKAEPAKVRTLIEEMATGYENPEEVINWYYNDKDQLAQIENLALEETVIDLILDKASVTEIVTNYEDVLQPPQSKVTADSEESAEQSEEKKPAKAKKKKAKAEPKKPED